MIQRLMKRIGTAETAPPWTLWGAVGAVVASFAAVIMGTTIATVLVDERQPGQNLIAWSIAMVLIVIFLRFTRNRAEQWDALRLKRGSAAVAEQNVFWHLLVGIGMAIVLDLIGRALTQQLVPEPELYRLAFYSQYYGQPVGLGWLLALLFMGLLQPAAETVVFQGLLLPSLRTALGAWPGYLVSGAVFGAFHFVAYPPVGSDFASLWYGLGAPLLAGLIYSAVRIYTGSTRAALITHVAFGLFAVVKLLTLVG